MSNENPLEHILSCLEAVEEASDGSYQALCPAHDDHDPSLSVSAVVENGSQKVLIRCWAGCEQDQILKKLGLEWKDLFSQNGSNDSKKSGRRIVATYDYTDAAGNLLHQSVRYEPKGFSQRRPDGSGGWEWNLRGVEPVLYRLPEVLEACLKGETIYVFEGEKDVDRAREELGITATTCAMGAQKWCENYTYTLIGANVILVPDNDEAGRKHVLKVAQELKLVAASVRILELPGLPDKGDFSNWLDADGTREAFDALVEEAPEFDSGHIGEEFGRNEFLPVKSVSEIMAESEEGADWKVDPLLAKGNITDLSGEAKFSGKTTLAMHMIACLRKGEDFMGFPTRKSKVLYLTEQGNNFAEALQKAGLQDADGELFVVQHRDVRVMPWEQLVPDAVEECVRRGADVLVIDTFAAFSGIVGNEENNSGDIRDKMAPLKEAAQEHDLAVLYIRHAGKSGRARGSSQFEAEGDIILTLKRPEGNHDENVRVLEGIGRYDEIPRKLNIELTDQGYVARGSDARVEFRRAFEAIKQHVPSVREDAMTQDELLEALKDEDVAKKTMQRALTWLVDEETVRREGAGVKGNPYRYWVPPDAPQSSPGPEEDIHSGQTPSLNGWNGKSEKNEGVGQIVSSAQMPGEPEFERRTWGELIIDPERLLTEVVPALKRCESVALDIETTGLSHIEDRVRLLSISAGTETFLIDGFVVDPSPVLEVLQDKVLYIHGAEFDLPFLYHAYGFVSLRTPMDTMHLSRTVRAGEGRLNEEGKWAEVAHDLKEVLRRELGIETGDKKKFQSGEAWKGELTEEHLEYATADVLYLHPLKEKLFELLKERNLEETWALEQRAKPAILEACLRGIPFHKEGRDEKISDLSEQAKVLKKRTDGLAPEPPMGGEWNWNSPPQIKQALRTRGIDVPNVRRETLAKHDNEPLAKAISEYRNATSEISKMRKWEKDRYRDGRVYPRWSPYGSATGRVTCSEPNVQSLPKKGGWRACVRPPRGRVLVKADLSQIELRVLAAYTKDENMLEVFRGGGDIHTATAEAIVGHPVVKGSPERDAAKAVNFGFSFGMGAKRLQQYAAQNYGVELNLLEARAARRKFLESYPNIKTFPDSVAELCKGGVWEARSVLGRRRVVPPNFEDRPSFTEMINHPIQATAADILKVALAELHESREEHPDAFPIITVHDEVVIECPEEDAEGVSRWLAQALQEAVESVLGFPELASEDVAETSVIEAWGAK